MKEHQEKKVILFRESSRSEGIGESQVYPVDEDEAVRDIQRRIAELRKMLQ